MARQHQAKADDTSPAVDHQRSSNRGQDQAGINGVPQMGVGGGAHEFVIFLECDPGAQVFRKMIARPDSQSYAGPNADDAESAAPHAPGNDVVSQKTNPS